MKSSKLVLMRASIVALCFAATGSILLACSGDDDANNNNNPPNNADSGLPDGQSGEGGSDGGADSSQSETSTPGSPLPTGIRDRAGKPFVSVLLVSGPNRDAYNKDRVDLAAPTDPELDPDAGGTSFGSDFQAVLSLLDGLDGNNDWNGGGPDAGPDDAGVFKHPLANSWIYVDALIVDPTKPFAESSYLDIEVNSPAHTTCGGRWFGDDALDKTMSYLVKKSRSGIGDGVAAPAKPVSQTFPYLAAPF